MSQPVTPEQKQDLLAGYVLCNLSPEESMLLQQLLVADPALYRELEAMQGTLEQTYLTAVKPPEDLQDKVMQAFSADNIAPLPSSSQLLAAVPTRKFWLRRTLGAIAAGLIVGLSISNYVLWRSLQAQKSVVAQLQFVLKSTAANEMNSIAQIKVDPERLRGTLVVQNLPPLAEDQVYVLWTVVQPNTPVTTDDKNAILTEVFTIPAQGRAEIEMVVPAVFQELDVVKAVAITIEDRDAPQQHQAAPILMGAVSTEAAI